MVRIFKLISILLVLYTPAYGMSEEFVKITQSLLNQLGFNAGKPDGIYGKQTKLALESFYASKGLRFDGVLDDNEREDITNAILASANSDNTELSGSGLSLIAEDGTYLGCWGCGRYSSDSICNKNGSHGSKYSGVSIWNKYGDYGSKYSSKSPWNKYSSSGPKLKTPKGRIKGQFSINIYAGFDQSKELKDVYETSRGNLKVVRQAVCK
ncbi:peptidoglycan-binding protein [Paracoccaceae bacterium]|nr:peptidoglycan-binding protein [Paracoccaceae bacterium]